MSPQQPHRDLESQTSGWCLVGMEQRALPRKDLQAEALRTAGKGAWEKASGPTASDKTRERRELGAKSVPEGARPPWWGLQVEQEVRLGDGGRTRLLTAGPAGRVTLDHRSRECGCCCACSLPR